MIVDAGLALSEIVKGEKPCGGHGKCGKCKVIAKGELSAPDLLACVQYAVDYPHRTSGIINELDLFSVGTLSFFEEARDGTKRELGSVPLKTSYGVEAVTYPRSLWDRLLALFHKKN